MGQMFFALLIFIVSFVGIPILIYKAIKGLISHAAREFNKYK